MKENKHKLIEDRLGKRARVKIQERAVLVGLDFPERNSTSWGIKDSMNELASLGETAGLVILHRIVQRRAKPDPSYFVGKGKVDEIKEVAHDRNANVIIFNNELSPAQARNLEQRTGIKVVDRNQLIMDIFAQRATTKEAKLQVELAQLEYLLPRLRGWGEALERLGGGIGTRGPGETRLERDRQKIKRRIESIKGKLSQAAKEWEVRRKRRVKNEIPEIALVGYTNTGKTTLLNKLTHSEGFTENKLFATLDPLTRSMKLPDKREIILIDTVGLIRDLPHQLIPAFRSTLKSARNAALLINVMDASKDQLIARWQTVNKILNEDVFGDKQDRPPVINILNKIDLVHDRGKLNLLSQEIDNSVTISALNDTNLQRLKSLIAAQLGDAMREVSIKIPYSQGNVLEWLHEHGTVTKEEYEKDAIIVQGTVEKHLLQELERKGNGLKFINET